MVLTVITTQVIDVNAVTETKVANNSIGTRQLIDGSVTLDKLASNATGILIPFNNTSTSTGSSNVFIIQAPNTTTGVDYINVSMDGIDQPQADWIFISANDSVQFKDASIGAGIIFNVDSWYT